jgi:hypothetical protein
MREAGHTRANRSLCGLESGAARRRLLDWNRIGCWKGVLEGLVERLCVLKIRFCNSNDEGRRGPGADAHVLNGAIDRSGLVERPMSPQPIIIGRIASSESGVSVLRPRQPEVDALASDRSNQPFGEAVLPRRAWGDRLVTDAHGTQSVRDGSAIDAIPITEHVARQGNASVIWRATQSAIRWVVTLIQIRSWRSSPIFESRRIAPGVWELSSSILVVAVRHVMDRCRSHPDYHLEGRRTKCRPDASNSSTQNADMALSRPMAGAPMFSYISMRLSMKMLLAGQLVAYVGPARDGRSKAVNLRPPAT